ncbi:Aldo/keto reductase [Flagelloscypha sp. PMI_526]|nr:Aldo/keto reductase [Flagelloscypha sp. PMI_526]
MLYVSLGNSGLKVSKLILGCMTYGDPAWSDPSWVLGEQESIDHIKFAFENGINTFDTADVYCGGASEVILGKALKTLGVPREDYVVMTKVFFPVTPKIPKNFMAPEFKNKRGLSRKHVFDAVKGSLERLQLDYVDVLQCHRFDNETPIEETMKALHDVIEAGYARYIGMSACYGYQFHLMQNYAITHNLTPFISMQNQYNLVYREEEREMFPILKHFGIGSIPYAPLAAGYLTRPIEEGKSTFRATNDKFGLARYEGLGAQEQINKKVQEIATNKGISMAQVALAWLLQKKGVTAPIVGTTSTEKMKDLISALDVQLDAEEVKSLEELYVPRPLNGLL